MRLIVADLVDYVVNRTASRALKPAVETVGDTEVRIVAIKLLGWLKELARKGKHKPLTFNERYTWCQNLLVLLSAIPQLNELIEVNGNRIDFRGTVLADEQAEIEKHVDVNYNPKLRI